MEEKTKKVNKSTLVLAILFVGFIITFCIRRAYLLSHYERYTIGTTINIFYTVPANKNVTYKYEVSHKIYQANYLYNDDSKVPGGRYYVRFSAKNPSISDLLQDQPVPDSIKVAPPNGWSKIP